ncbi:hypothetical protein GCM10023237_01270 [Streptomyces coeruleoprunus]
MRLGRLPWGNLRGAIRVGAADGVLGGLSGGAASLDGAMSERLRGVQGLLDGGQGRLCELSLGVLTRLPCGLSTTGSGTRSADQVS